MYKVFLVNEGKAMTRGGEGGKNRNELGIGNGDSHREEAIKELGIPRINCCQPRGKCGRQFPWSGTKVYCNHRGGNPKDYLLPTKE